MTAVAIQHREQILTRIAAGEFVSNIAVSLGLERSTLSQHMRGDPVYLRAREDGYEAQLDKALAAIEAAGDDLTLARAREVYAKRLEWRAERECPARWGQRVIAQPVAQISITIGVVRDGDQARVVADVIPSGIVAAAPQFPVTE